MIRRTRNPHDRRNPGAFQGQDGMAGVWMDGQVEVGAPTGGLTLQDVEAMVRSAHSRGQQEATAHMMERQHQEVPEQLRATWEDGYAAGSADASAGWAEWLDTLPMFRALSTLLDDYTRRLDKRYRTVGDLPIQPPRKLMRPALWRDVRTVLAAVESTFDALRQRRDREAAEAARDRRPWDDERY